MDAETNHELWEVEANGQVLSTNFAEMTAWIGAGSLLRIDRVRKGNLRWIEAGKVPSLLEFFNAKDASEPLPPVISTTTTEVLGVTEQAQQFTNAAAAPTSADPTSDVCSMHPDAPAKYICDTCSNLFCKACPNSYGGNVKICPFCGAMCRPLAETAAHTQQTYSFQKPMTTEAFGFNDFGKAIAYPFKFKTSLLLGAFMYMIFSIGQGVVGFGGIFMMFSALICFLLANTLTFGVLANTVENFSQGKVDVNFMPTFDDFTLWDDVVHPFFLSIGTYIVSFGPVIVVGVFAVFFMMNTAKSGMNGIQSDFARAINPDLAYAPNAMQQSDKVKELINNANEAQKRRIQMMSERETAVKDPVADAEDDRAIQPDATTSRPTFSNPEDFHNPSAVKLPSPTPNSATAAVDPDEEYFNKTNKMILDSRKAQLESAFGKTTETVANERNELIKKLIGYGVVFILIAAVCMLWGLFYFPAALAVAGYTRSFTATLNPLLGLDTIRHLGLDYAKILLMGLALAVASGFVSGVFATLLQAFDMPSVGNLPARALGSLFGFYFSVVFSCVIAFALYKAADRLKLAR